MKIIPLATLLCAGIALSATSCRSSSPTPKTSDTVPAVDSVYTADTRIVKPSTYIPAAIVYKTSGDYNNNVPITLTADGKIASYPAPTDITDSSTPIQLIDGWLLDRRGISKNTAFTTYTYDEYRKLKQAPTQEELLDHIIKDAKITAIMQLPMRLQEAEADIAAVDSIIRTSRLTKLYEAPSISL